MKFSSIAAVLLFVSSLSAESTFTNLTDPQEIRAFHDVTGRIRCICIPSIAIKSCSFNNCTVSAKLKVFIENRIRSGESADTIVEKMVKGFGPDAVKDPVIAKFIESGNTGMAESVVYGFGPDILAKPDSTWIDASLFMAGALGILLMFLYLKKRTTAKASSANPSQENEAFRKYLSEIEEKQK
ncbi:cytochrome C biogenesis protein [Leptospira fletcheri]|uniref:Cytochrome c-type biogenesis protein n=1 Tax=Leptospira fletcheri TaxID=2484981 RepID=A0A4R9G4I1_9LEPT|nr:cytochrome c-type biogenesis protein CcmH [Leptospira fletcheri]TGK06428.1 cytochrome C biogenesis protein [Leptospira fletcheri]